MKACNLKKGDRFSERPAAWYGPGTVIASFASGDCWCIKFDNSKIVNPPGIIYVSPNATVRLLKKAKQ
jgi:hypothetical protein